MVSRKRDDCPHGAVVGGELLGVFFVEAMVEGAVVKRIDARVGVTATVQTALGMTDEVDAG